MTENYLTLRNNLKVYSDKATEKSKTAPANKQAFSFSHNKIGLGIENAINKLR